MFQTKFAEKIKTCISCSITYFEIMPIMRQRGKVLYTRAGHRWQYDACALHARYISLQMQCQNMKSLLFFHCKYGLYESVTILRHTYILFLVYFKYFHLLASWNPSPRTAAPVAHPTPPSFNLCYCIRLQVLYFILIRACFVSQK